MNGRRRGAPTRSVTTCANRVGTVNGQHIWSASGSSDRLPLRDLMPRKPPTGGEETPPDPSRLSSKNQPEPEGRGPGRGRIGSRSRRIRPYWRELGATCPSQPLEAHTKCCRASPEFDPGLSGGRQCGGTTARSPSTCRRCLVLLDVSSPSTSFVGAPFDELLEGLKVVLDTVAVEADEAAD